MRPLLTVNETAALLRISRGMLYKLIKSGDLEPVMVGERLRFRQETIESYCDRHSLPAEFEDYLSTIGDE